MRYIICLSLLGLSLANTNAQNSVLIPGLSDELSIQIPIFIAQVANSYAECMKTIKSLSQINKKWHKVTNKYASAQSAERKLLGLTLGIQVYINPKHAINWNIEVIKIQREQRPSSSYAEQCLGYAVMWNKKDLIKDLCFLPNIKINYEMDFPIGKMPLLAGAIQSKEPNTDIIKYLLEAGANRYQKFEYQETINPWDLLSYSPEFDDPTTTELMGTHCSKITTTPFALALKSGNQSICDLIVPH